MDASEMEYKGKKQHVNEMKEKPNKQRKIKVIHTNSEMQKKEATWQQKKKKRSKREMESSKRAK